MSQTIGMHYHKHYTKSSQIWITPLRYTKKKQGQIMSAMLIAVTISQNMWNDNIQNDRYW